MNIPKPIETLNKYADYLADGGIREHSNGEPVMSDGELLDLVIEVTNQEPSDEGLPTDRDILMSINNALYYHFDEE
jgi:hypothetical protein